ncbi:MAG: hypothetical protein EAZ65_04550 [Verrucomicrobia bacterium]|nr:MAG: hypothetical protein EAZ84_00765 [Verrucomicrobiota bacterium]TAE88013.1 MAG: hypothetical protein EAZ82_05800 [Verrucomicrobiota bacterium]TAF26236.1 MAG: hypothetical protein EAZ71_05365 [Verrucomicrobiota bacterium]TAF41791.1 MAG: hypothetical protein EAZ65_04550 [Verrucomicrobiota bacterium]
MSARLPSLLIPLLVACLSPVTPGAEPVARMAEDGRSFTLSVSGFDDFRATWSADIQREDGEIRQLKSSGGEVESGSARVIHFPEDKVELLFELEVSSDAPAVFARAGIRNTGSTPVKLLHLSPVAAEWKLPTDLNGWLLTGFHPRAPLVQGLRYIHQPLKVHEYGGCYHGGERGFLFGPVGEPVAYIAGHFARSGKDRMFFNLSAEMSGVRVDPGETRWGQQVTLLVEPSRAALPRWAGWVGQSHHARANRPALTGWGSWYSFGDKITSKDLLAQLDTVSRHRDRLRPDVVLIDKGHEVRTQFPEGPGFCAKAIAATGARPGIRLELNQAADPVQVVRQAVRDGFRYLKLGDFRPAQARPDPKLTEFERIRRLYAAFRETAGPDTYLLDCPLSLDRAAVGHVDAARSGRTASRKDVVPAIPEVLRSYHLHGRWFAIDNDHFYLGTDLANVSEIVGGWPVVRTWMSMAGLSCGAAFTSDPLNLPSVEPYWRNLEVMTPPARERTEVLDLGGDWRWPRLVGQVRREWGDATVALLWNSEDKEQAIPLSFKKAGMDPERRYAVWSFWDNRYLGLAQKSWTTPALAPAASQHLRFTPLPSNSAPVLIGSNLHIYCGAAEIESIRSSPASMSIALSDAGARAGDLFVYSRYLPVMRSASGLVVSAIDQAGENVWRIRVNERQRGVAQRIELDIQLPVTRQGWFWALIALLIAAFLTAAWRYLVSLRLARRLALDEERSRISRDLHDGMSADLTQIALVAEMTSREPGLAPVARQQLNRIVASAHHLAGELDSVVWATNPGNDTLEQLVQYLGSHAQGFLEAADLRLRFDIPEHLPDLAVGSAVRHNLFLAAKEALHNVVRHAGATRVILRIRMPGHALVVEIEDDGRGVGPRASPRRGEDGISNMADRMLRIQGACETLPGKNGRGTVVRFTVPLKELDSPAES